MLFRETVAVYFENNMEHRDTLCEQNVDSFNVRPGGIYSYHCVYFVNWYIGVDRP
jgi:hypothetical protein